MVIAKYVQFKVLNWISIFLVLLDPYKFQLYYYYFYKKDLHPVINSRRKCPPNIENQFMKKKIKPMSTTVRKY